MVVVMVGAVIVCRVVVMVVVVMVVVVTIGAISGRWRSRFAPVDCWE